MFWDRFYYLCKENKSKPNPVAKELGISSGIITRWKHGNILPTGENLIKIANSFNVSIDYLVGHTNNPKINK